MNSSYTTVLFLALLIPTQLIAAAPPGQVVIWGNTLQSGTNRFVERLEVGGKPVTDAIGISAGKNHALILRADGTLMGWGRNFYGQISMPNALTNVIQVAAGDLCSRALDKSGNVIGWGYYQINFGAAGDIISISAGCLSRALALKRDGTVFNWSGDFTGVVPKLKNIVAVAAGGGDGERNLALRNDGVVFAWSRSDMSQVVSNAVAIAVGERHSLALKRDGTVYGWGDNHCEQATGVKTASGQRNASGLVVHSGQVLSNVVAIAAGNQYGMFGMVTHHSLALKNDGTVVGWGRICGAPVFVPEGLSNVVAIAAGQTFCLAITTNAVVAERFSR